MQGGADRSWSKPFNPEPSAGEPYGTHRGHMQALNIRNRRPGFHYAYAHRSPQYQGLTYQMVMQGFQPVQASASGPALGAASVPGMFGSPQDSVVGFGNLMLMEIPIERYRQLLAEKATYREQATASPTRAFLDRSAEFEAAYGPSAAGTKPLYAMPQHGATGYETKDPTKGEI